MSFQEEGNTHEEAVDHVHRFYQYKETNPEFIKKFNRWGFGDYFGYSWDSTRIWAENFKYAATEALGKNKNGKANIKPLIGLMASLTIPVPGLGGGAVVGRIIPTAIGVTQAAPFGTIGWVVGNALQALGLKEDDDDDKFRIATDAEITALRNSLPSYDRNQRLGIRSTTKLVSGICTGRFLVTCQRSRLKM